jgi:hypothetical protein
MHFGNTQIKRSANQLSFLQAKACRQNQLSTNILYRVGGFVGDFQRDLDFVSCSVFLLICRKFHKECRLAFSGNGSRIAEHEYRQKEYQNQQQRKCAFFHTSIFLSYPFSKANASQNYDFTYFSFSKTDKYLTTDICCHFRYS